MSDFYAESAKMSNRSQVKAVIPMYDELINKLYHCANEVFCNKCSYSPDCAGEKTIIREAADAIEELQKQLQKSEVDNINLTGWLAEEHAKQCPHYIRNVHDRGDDSLCDKWMCEVASLPKWVPVTERLPEEYEYVLCRTDYGMEVGYHRDEWGQDEWTTGELGSETIDVSHWMPLPQPPESGDSLSCGICDDSKQKESEGE